MADIEYLRAHLADILSDYTEHRFDIGTHGGVQFTLKLQLYRHIPIVLPKYCMSLQSSKAWTNCHGTTTDTFQHEPCASFRQLMEQLESLGETVEAIAKLCNVHEERQKGRDHVMQSVSNALTNLARSGW